MLTALIAYLHYEAPKEEQNFATLLEMLNTMQVSEDDEDFQNPVDLLFEDLAQKKPNSFAGRQYKLYKLAAGKTAKSILISCGARLAPFDIQELRDLTMYDELELDMLGDRKTALFLIMSDTDSTFNFLISMVYTQLFNLLCDKADDQYGGKLPIHVRCLIDECANIGAIPQLEKLVATIRSREISACLVLQTRSQLKAIPTMYDRAMQALYALALEPVAETTADGKSFGFRKGRCAQDACEYLFNALSRKHISPKWVLEGDIKGCFDHISHDWLLANIPMDKNILKQFLKAGFIYQRELFPTEEGTPQGGIISPILANMTLDGIEKKLVERFHTNALGKVDLRFKNAHKVNFVRYADDFVVTAATPELALEAKELIREFLAERGLELSDEKTVVTNIDDGFDFLGWNFRKYNEKLIIKPSKKAVKAIVSNISDTILRRGKAWQQDVLIMKLNEQIRGWTNYHQSVCASDAFAHLDYVLYELLWRWAKRRHPKKNKWWISMRYWHRVGNRNWVFSTENKELIRVDSTAIVRHTKIKATANPFLDEAYFQKRKFDKGMHRLTGKFKMIWKNQNGLCYHCGMPMDVTEEREIFYLAPKAKAGMEDVRNMRYVHCTCQRIYAENRLKK